MPLWLKQGGGGGGGASLMRGMVDGVERERLYKGRRLRLRVAAGGRVGSGRGGRGGSVLAKGARVSPNSQPLFYP